MIDESRVALDVHAAEPVSAIRIAGDLLTEAGRVAPEYVEAMVAAYHDLGAYIVLAPHIAIPHARPEAGALGSAISLVRLAEPVVFGHPANDPVRVVIALAGVDPQEHIDLLRRLAAVLSDPDAITTICTTDDVTEIVGLFTGEGAAS